MTLKGRLLVKNFEQRPATIAIDVKVLGYPTESSDEGTTAMDVTKLRLLERSGAVRYRLKLKPGEKKTLTYIYERYVPSR